MAFKLGDIIVDHIQYGFAEDMSGKPLYVLSQLNNGVINITAESQDITDHLGNRVATIYNAKNGEFTAENAFLSMPLVASKSGVDADFASVSDAIKMPKIEEVAKGKTINLEGYVDGYDITVSELDVTGNLGKQYTKGTEASATEFAISGTTLTPPTDTGVDRYIVKYQRDVTSGAKITAVADKMPKTIHLTLKVIIKDPCNEDMVKAAYVDMPSFQPSPEMEINFSRDTQTLSYAGNLNTKYCSADKELYTIFLADEDDSEDVVEEGD